MTDKETKKNARGIEEEKGLEHYLAQYQLWDTAARHFEKIQSETNFVASVSEQLALKRKREENLSDTEYSEAAQNFFSLLQSASPSELREHYRVIGESALKEASEGLIKKVEQEDVLKKVGEGLFRYLINPAKIDGEDVYLLFPAKTEDKEYQKIATNHAFYLEMQNAQQKPGAARELALRYHKMVYGSINMPAVGIGYLNNLYQLLSARAGPMLINSFADEKGGLNRDKLVGYVNECLKGADMNSKARFYSYVALDYLKAKA